MANKNKKVDSLKIEDDDDPTSELEVLSLPPSHAQATSETRVPHDSDDEERESDAATYGFHKDDDATVNLKRSIPELQSDLDSRGKTIGRLQHDIEQLRSKWLGLEAEIGAREEIVTDLGREVEQLNNEVALKDRILEKRDGKIEALKSQLRERDEARTLLEQQQTDLEQQLSEQRSAAADKASALDQAEKEIADLAQRLESTTAEQDALRAEMAELGESRGTLEEDRSGLAQQLEQATGELKQAEQELEQARASLKTAQDRHASDGQEIKQRKDAYEQLERNHAQLEERLEENAAALGEVERELANTQSELTASQQQVTTLTEDIDSRKAAYTSLEEGRLQLEQQLAETRQTLHSVEGELDSTRVSLEQAQADIGSLKADASRRDESYGALDKDHADLHGRLDETMAALEASRRDVENVNAELENERREGAARLELALKNSAADVKGMRDKLAGAEKYADTLRYKLKEFSESESQWDERHIRVSQSLDEVNQRNEELASELAAANDSIAELKAMIEQQDSEHEKEIRTLRFELSEAQETATLAASRNDELTSNLVDTRNSKVDVERVLGEKEHETEQRVAALEARIQALTKDRADLEEKLATKSEAINTLLGDLAKKTAQIESIGEVEEVIQDLGNRMSDRIEDQKKEPRAQPEKASVAHDRERTTRVLIGSFGQRELRFPLFKQRLTIGRVEENDIQLKTAYISRRHALILNDDDTARIIDTNSKNGVYVNSKRVKQHSLANGDTLSIGNVKFRYEERPKRDA